MTTKIEVDETEFKRRYDRGDELRTIAKHFEVGITKVRLLRNTMGLPHRNPYVSPEIMAKAEVMLEDGASFNEISRTLPISVQTLIRKFPGRGWTAVQAGQFRAMMRRYGEQ